MESRASIPSGFNTRASRSGATRLTAALGLGLAMISSSALADTIEWSGAGDGTTFSDGDNWVGGVAPTASDDIDFGDAAPNTAQVITLDANATVHDVIFSATGNRSYTINDASGAETLTIHRWFSTAGAQTLTQNAQTFVTGGNGGSSDTTFWGGGSTLIINGSHDHAGGSGFLFWQMANTAAVQFNSDWGNIGGGNARPISFENTFGTSEVIVNHANAIAEPGETTSTGFNGSNLLSLADDTTAAGFVLGNNSIVSLRFDGRTHAAAGDRRTITLSNRGLDNIGTVGTLNFQDDAAGSAVDGGVTLLITAAFNFDQESLIDFGTQADAVVEFAPQSAADADPDEVDVFGNIQGSGRVVVSSGVVHGVGDWTHTGGTDITGGTLQLGGAAVYLGSAQAGVGSLPDTGAVTVSAGGILDLNDNSESIGSLAGGGEVDLGVATLTLLGGVTPGDATGTSVDQLGELQIDEAGTLALGGSSNNVFQFEQLANDWDRVLMNTGDGTKLTLDGALSIVSDTGWTQTGDFILFDLDGPGDVSGAFTSFSTPEFMNATWLVDTNGDVILRVTAIPEPASALLLGLGSATLMGRRARR